MRKKSARMLEEMPGGILKEFEIKNKERQCGICSLLIAGYMEVKYKKAIAHYTTE